MRAQLPAATRFRDDFTNAAAESGLVAASFTPFLERVERLRAAERLTYDGLKAHGIDEIDRSVARVGDRWSVATYAFPQSDDELTSLLAIVDGHAGMVATGLDLVNRELGRQFLPQFIKGIASGGAIVVALMLLTFRDWRFVLLALTPTAIGLIWSGGVLGFAGVELDLFAIFAVMTFVASVWTTAFFDSPVSRTRRALSVTADLAPVIWWGAIPAGLRDVDILVVSAVALDWRRPRWLAWWVWWPRRCWCAGLATLEGVVRPEWRRSCRR